MIPLQSLRASGQESSAGRRTSPAVESMGSAWFPWKREHRELPLWHLGNADVALRSGWGILVLVGIARATLAGGIGYK